ncbi:hypothetical protein RV07_GL002184 [Enterococcus malodoratus]|nr:hypothetical protein RV07_GL002184 [Enterococcus malodoratus]
MNVSSCILYMNGYSCVKYKKKAFSKKYGRENVDLKGFAK